MRGRFETFFSMFFKRGICWRGVARFEEMMGGENSQNIILSPIQM